MWNNIGYGSHMWGADGMGWGWFMGLHGIFNLLIIGLIIYGVFYAIRTFSQKDNGSGGQALDVLSTRYANGEIDRDEYLQRKRDLELKA